MPRTAGLHPHLEGMKKVTGAGKTRLPAIAQKASTTRLAHEDIPASHPFSRVPLGATSAATGCDELSQRRRLANWSRSRSRRGALGPRHMSEPVPRGCRLSQSSSRA